MTFKNILSLALSACFIFACGSDTTTSTTEEQTEDTVDAFDDLPQGLDLPFDTIIRDNVRLKLSEIFKSAETANLNDFAKHIAYKGRDTERQYKVTLNINNSDERFTAESTMDVINLWLGNAEYKEYGIYKEEQGEELTFYIQEIVFMAPLNTERRKFTFVLAGDELLLANIK